MKIFVITLAAILLLSIGMCTGCTVTYDPAPEKHSVAVHTGADFYVYRIDGRW